MFRVKNADTAEEPSFVLLGKEGSFYFASEKQRGRSDFDLEITTPDQAVLANNTTEERLQY